MIGVTFVCLGNICRSPMAEAIFKRLTEERGVSGAFDIGSRATSDCEEGNPVYPPVASLLRGKGYDFKHFSRQLTLSDVKNSDYVLLMDNMNMRDVVRMTGGHYGDKIFMLGHFLPEEKDIDDPWYTREFDRAYSEIYSACAAFLDYLLDKHEKAVFYGRK